ncbi:MAG: hypothetical protein JNJ58_01615 [Chitinophagaceae bacterium]|nr:hypothetical protein [Chitinophagaceae bacterium]
MKKSILSLAMLLLTTISFAQKSSDKHYGKNIIAFNPVTLMSDSHVGVGFSYERLVNDYFGIKVPVMIGINSQYTNIGVELKLYPGRNNGPAKYAIAPMLMFGVGETRETMWQYNNQTFQNEQISIVTPRTHYGFLLNQTLNFTIMKNFYIGLDGGIGLNYYDSQVTNNNGNSHLSFAGQLQLAMGVRF